MKRSVALVLTVVIFAAIAVCFLRPAPDLNPDFGYADRFDGQHIPLKLEGDSEYFAESWVGRILPVYNSFYVCLRPKEQYHLTPGTPKLYENGHMEWFGADWGYIERRVNGKWEYFGDAQPTEGPLVQQIGYAGTCGNSLNWEGFGLIGSGLDVDATMLHTPGEYRVTVKFHVAISNDEVEEEEHRVSFRYTVPKVTKKPFDVLQTSATITNDEYHNNLHRVYVVLRLNHGTPAPYVLLNGEYYPAMRERYIDEETDMDIERYCVLVSEDYADECTETFHFAEHSDGSGEQYDLTLNLRFK